MEFWYNFVAIIVKFFSQCEEQVWDKIFDINVKSAYLLAKEAVPLIRKRGGGSIVFVSSIAGFQPFKVSLNSPSQLSYEDGNHLVLTYL